MKYLACILLIFTISATNCAPKPPYQTYPEADNALKIALNELHIIYLKFPKDNVEEHVEDYKRIPFMVKSINAMKSSLNEENFRELNDSQDLKNYLAFIEKYRYLM